MNRPVTTMTDDEDWEREPTDEEIAGILATVERVRSGEEKTYSMEEVMARLGL